MATQEKTWNVANRMHSQKDSDNPAVNHIITGADEIYDDAKGLKQSEHNTQTDVRLNEVETDLNASGGGIKDRVHTLEEQVAFDGDIEVENDPQYIIAGSGKVTSANAVRGAIDVRTGYFVCESGASTAAKTINAPGFVLTSGGSIKIKMTNVNTADNATLNINSTGAKALYYGGERASASNTWEAGETVEVYYDGTNFYANNVAGGSGSGDGAFDVSAKYPTSGVEGGNTYTLEGALAVLNANLSASKKKGGMIIKFIQSSDNKYVQYRLMADSFTTDVTQWQGVDAEITAGSHNLAESGSIFNLIKNEVGDFDFSDDKLRVFYNLSGNAQYSTYRLKTIPIAVKQGDKIRYKIYNSETVYSIAALNNGVLDTNVSILGSNTITEGEFIVPANITHIIFCHWPVITESPYARLQGSILQNIDELKTQTANTDSKVTTVETIAKSIDSRTSNNLVLADFKNHLALNSNGTVTEIQSFYTTDYIKVNTGDVIEIESSMYGNDLCLAAYDENLLYLSDKSLNKDALTADNKASYTVTGNVKYIRVSTRASSYAKVDFSKINLKTLDLKVDTIGTNVNNINNELINILPLDSKSIVWGQVSEFYILPDIYNYDIDYIGIAAPSGVAPATGLILNAIKVESGTPQSKFQSRWWSLPQEKTLLEIRVTSTNEGYPSVGTLLGYVYIHDINYFKTASYGNSTYYQLNKRFVTILKNCPTISRLLYGSDSFSSDVSIVLPPKIYAVEGDTLQLFHKSVVKAANPYDYSIEVLCSYGKLYKRYFTYTPETSHKGTNVDLTYRVVNNNNVVVASKTTKLYVLPKLSSPETNKNILLLGASNLAYGQVITELHRRLCLTTGDGTPANPTGLGLSNITFVGKKVVNGLHLEAWGGYSWRTYTTNDYKYIRYYVSGVTRVDIDSTYRIDGVSQSTTYYMRVAEVNITGDSGNILCQVNGGYIYAPGVITAPGTLIKMTGTGDSTINFTSYDIEDGNPFWNISKDELDIKMYADNYCNGQIDAVVCILGTNGIAEYTTQLNYARQFIRKYHEQFPNGKFVLGTLHIPNPNGPLGMNSSSTFYKGVCDRYGYYQGLLDIVNDSEFSSFVSIMNISAEFDSEYSYPYIDKNVNNRITTFQEAIGTNNAHPSNEGYGQFADSFYRAITSLGLS